MLEEEEGGTPNVEPSFAPFDKLKATAGQARYVQFPRGEPDRWEVGPVRDQRSQWAGLATEPVTPLGGFGIADLGKGGRVRGDERLPRTKDADGSDPA